jgi:hypothetical protein
MKSILQIQFILLLFGASVLPAAGQENHVYYNLFNDSVTYVRAGKPVKVLKLRKGEDVRIHLTEFNPFTSDVQLEVEEISTSTGFELSGMAGLEGLLPGMTSGLGGILSGGLNPEAGTGAPLLDIPVVVVNNDTLSLKSLFANTRGGADASQASAMMQEISTLMTEVSSLYQELKAVEKSVMVSRMALVNVEPLRQHPNIRPSLVQQLCREYYDVVFQKSEGEAISLNDLLAWQTLGTQHELIFQRIKAKQGDLSAKIGVLEGMSKALTGNPVDNASGQKFIREMIDFQVKSRGVRDQIKDFTAKPTSLGELPSVQEMAELQLKLAEVISNDFTHHTTIQPTADQVNLGIKLQRKTADIDKPELVKERNLRLEVRGGMKVHASAGLSFGRFFEQGQSYSVNNGVIAGEDDGAFTPSLATFLHFHGYRGQKATIGGTFGAGFPMLSAGDGQSVEFFLGPSLMLGAAQKLVISAGIKGGRVQRLAKGYEVGDVFDANFGDIPTTGKYALGLFLGASFNLGQ